jgi:ketol-acid reductoisomerase
MATFQFGTTQEEVVTRQEFTLELAHQVLQKETMAVLGYGIQGAAQAMNLRDQGFNVMVGQRQGGPSWDRALADGWIKGETLFDPLVAAERATVVMYLLTDVGQMDLWPQLKPLLTAGKTLYFSHGFSVVYNDQTGVVPPADVDVVLVAPKGPGKKVRDLFVAGAGVNSSYAVQQDASGQAKQKALALGIGIGSGYLFETTFAKEVHSDHVGERGVLMGALTGIIEAQYNLLRSKGHSPSEAFNETVEELTHSLIPLIDDKGMDYMYANCSMTAQRGALDWRHEFRKAVEPVFERLYQSVLDGVEVKRVITAHQDPNYRAHLKQELADMANSELWQAGAAVRALRPDQQ